MNALVSIIIPVYRVEEFIDRCMESIVCQTYGNLEIILVDDGSPDNSPQKCDEWAEKDLRVKVIHKENAGPGMARNSGLDIATGDYITFVDSDDYLALDAVECMLDIVERDHSDLVVAQKVKIYCDRTQEPSAYTWLHATLVDKNEAMHMIGSRSRPFPASLWARLYRRRIFDNVRFPALKTGEDTYVLPEIIDQCNKISFTDKVAYCYFQRNTSIVHTMTREKRLDNIKSVLHVARYLLDHDYLEEARLYYNSAVCQKIILKNDQEATRLIKDNFNKKERRILHNSKDTRLMADRMIARFPNMYKFYKSMKIRLK